MRTSFVTCLLFVLEACASFQNNRHHTRRPHFDVVSSNSNPLTTLRDACPKLYSSTPLGNDDSSDETSNSSSNNNNDNNTGLTKSSQDADGKVSWLDNKMLDGIPLIELLRPGGYKKLPPMQVEDVNLLFYDVFLLINLTTSISFWVTHRMDFSFIPSAFNEGCLLSLLWIGSGLYHGSFLMSSVDGHYGSADERGGPKAAAALALNTFVTAVNFRLLFAFLIAVFQHRQVGVGSAEQLLPLEIAFGILLMSGWRGLHSYITPRF